MECVSLSNTFMSRPHRRDRPYLIALGTGSSCTGVECVGGPVCHSEEYSSFLGGVPVDSIMFSRPPPLVQ